MDTSVLVEARPSYVKFERRAVEDRAASIAQGRYTTRDVDFAVVTPAGTKDRIERIAAEWFAMLEQQAREERIPPAWVESYKQQYEAFKKGEEAPLKGTPIREWPVVSPAQRQLLISLNVLTVEDLAQATAEAIQAIGMGGQMLKQKAQAWLKSAEQGKATEMVAGLQAENATLKTLLEGEVQKRKELEERILALEKGTKK
jgi:hypothetical protein